MKPMTILCAMLAAGASAALAAAEEPLTVTIDPSKDLGLIKPIHGVNNGPVKAGPSQCRDNFNEFKAAKIPSVRTHDSVYFSGYGKWHTIDISSVFPVWEKDENDPKSYDFTLTDKYVGEIIDSGATVYYRLGQSIEHGIKQYYIWPPKDNAKWARIAEHVIRHYTEGWADGFRHYMPHWEIWNEPNNNPKVNPSCWGGTDEEFFEFFAVAAKHLKKCFPHLKIGGPATNGTFSYSPKFLAAMRKMGVPLDFFSWHGYSRTVYDLKELAEMNRRCMDQYGYTNAESHCTEWNYVKGWGNEWPYTLRVESGDLNWRGAAYTMATLSMLQDSSVDLAHYYDARPCGMNGLFDLTTYRVLRGYYPFYSWSKLRDLGRQVATSLSRKDDEFFVTAAKGYGGKVGAVVCRYTDDANVFMTKAVRLKLAGGQSLATARIHLTDQFRMFTEVAPIDNGDGTVTVKMDPNSFIFVEGSTKCWEGDPEPETVTEKIELFNGKDLTNWYVWISKYGRSDPKGVFTVKDGVIRVHGPEGYNGGITTERSFRDYRLVVEFRYTGELFGSKKKQNAAPDSGILFHSTGPDGAFYGVWMSSWEFNLITGANGDFWSVIDGRQGHAQRPDMHMTVRGDWRKIGPSTDFVYDPNGKETIVLEGGCRHAFNSHVVPTYRNRAGDPVQDCEKPVGEWNTAELICDGDRATCIMNGVVVNVGENIYPSWGRIQLQNESCGCEFRRITLYPLDRNAK